MGVKLEADLEVFAGSIADALDPVEALFAFAGRDVAAFVLDSDGIVRPDLDTLDSLLHEELCDLLGIVPHVHAGDGVARIVEPLFGAVLAAEEFVDGHTKQAGLEIP